MTRTLRRICAAVAVAAVLMLHAPLADAHTQLVSSDPAAGATESQLPEQVTLTFDQPLLTTGDVNHISVVDPMGQQIASPAILQSPTVLTAVLSPSMVMAGNYSVAFRVVAGDGHPVEGSYRFSVGATQSGAPSVPVPSSGTVVLTVAATGQQITDGKGDPSGTASGEFTIDFGAGTICYTVVSSLTDVRGIHIHARNTDNLTVADEISIPVSLEALNSSAPVCGTPPAEDLAKLAAAPDRFALVVHTKDYPEGAVMGVFTGPTDSAATGTGGSAGGSGPGPWIVGLGLGLLLLIAVGAFLWSRRAATRGSS